MNRRTFLILVFFYTVLIAKDGYLNIDADYFEADEKKHQMYFKGNVKLNKNQDILQSKYLLINTEASKEDKNKQVPKDYMATGNVKFTVHTKDNILKGKGDKVYYYPKEQKYIIVGNGYLEDLKNDKKIIADKIYVNEKTGHIKIDGGENKPVQFRLKLDDKKDVNKSE